jgi:hypothetical protein
MICEICNQEVEKLYSNLCFYCYEENHNDADTNQPTELRDLPDGDEDEE